MTEHDPVAPQPGHFLPGGAGADDAEPLARRAYGWSDARRQAAVVPDTPERRRLSRPTLAGLVVTAVLLAAAGVAGTGKLIDAYDGLADGPLGAPTLKPAAGPAQREPSPTVTVTAKVVPPDQVVKSNRLYRTGRLRPSHCHEPAARPDSQQDLQRYVDTMLPCLSASWAPSVRKADAVFRAPHVRLFEGVSESPCEGYATRAHYCSDDETIYLPWRKLVSDYRDDAGWARASLADTFAHEFGHHVQHLTGILEASESRSSGAPSKAAALEESRRLELQASCFAAVYLGADRQWFPMKGGLREEWVWQAKHSGDEYNPEEIRDHGSRKSNAGWVLPAFETTDPGSCNTFTAPSARVS